MNRPQGGQLLSHPLHIIYNSDHLAMPLKFTHNERTFDLDLYFLTKHETQKDLTAFYLSRQASSACENKNQFPFVDELLGKRTGVLTLYTGADLNSKTKKLAALREDPQLVSSEL